MHVCQITGIFFLITIVFCHDDEVYSVKYTSDDFAKEIQSKSHFVMFYAPWCGHCQRLSSTWEQLAEMLNEDDSNIKIAKVDCTTDSQVCSDHDVTGYPTLKFFKTGSTEGVKFKGTRDLPTLTTFINEQLRESNEEQVGAAQSISGLIELNDDSFERHVASGKHFVKFYAPWCGHCQKLAPVWEQVAKSPEYEKSVSIAKLDCTQYRSICNQFEVKGYPTLLWIEDGKKVEKYQGERSHENLKIYINKMLGANILSAKNDKPEHGEASGGTADGLNGNNFKSSIKNGVTFVKFFAPWCGHCKRLAPTWEELNKKFANNKNVNIVKVDCTLDGNKDLCNDQEVEGFPSIFLYKNGQKISEYTGNRSLDDMFDFIKQHVSHDEL